MPKIKKEICLKCTPQEAFNQISKFDFVEKINSNVGVETKVIFKNERIVRYYLKVKNVGEWQSERVLIPESNLILIQRRTPLAPFKYMIVIYEFKEYYEATKLIYTEEFLVEDKSIELEKKIFANISEKVNLILKDISDSFNLNN